MAAHLSDLDASVELKVVSDMPSGVPAQVQTAREATTPDQVIAAVWIETTNDEFYIYVSDRGSERILLQTLPHSPDGWDAECDAIATLVRSALTPWLAAEASDEPEPVPAESPESERPPKTPTQDTPESPVRMIVAAGYSITGLSFEKGPLLSSGRLSMGARLLRRLEIDLTVLISEPADMKTEGIRLIRTPVELGALAIWPVDRFDLGVRAGLALDFTHVRGIDISKAPDDTDSVNVGFTPSFVFRYYTLNWLALWMDVGIYIFKRNKHYAWNDEPVLTYGRVQPRLTAGLTFVLRLE
ncbi:MAG: hypothetical protein GY854_34125 [Deltaproteobacteria bacterium]|nr:hypothetical protein [Deltaproteobacteria bacterium]